MRMLRIVLIAVGALVALLAIAVIGLLLFVDPNRYRGDIQRIALEKTGRQLDIGGKLELKIFPWLALGIHDVKLGNPPGFGSDPFLTVQNASIGVKLLPLLSKRLQISRLSVDGLAVDLITRGEKNNWQDLGESKGTPPAAASSGSSPDYASIEGIDIAKSRVIIRDETKKSSTQLTNLEMHTGRIATDPTHTVLENLKLDGSYLSTAADQPESKPLAFGLRIPAVSVQTGTQMLDPAKIEAKLGDTSVQIKVGGRLSPQRALQGTLSIPKTSARKLMQSAGITPPVTRDRDALAAFALQTNFALTARQATLSDLLVTLDDTQIRGTAAIEDLDRNALSFNLNLNGINADRYRGPAAVKKTAVAPAAAEPPTPLPLETLRKLDIHGTLHLGNLTFAALVFSDVTLPLVAKDGHIRLGPTQARIYGGTYNGDIVLDTRPVQAQLSLNEHLRGTDIGALAKAAVDSTRVAGHADANVVINGVGNTDNALMRSLAGRIDANIKQGALVGIDIQYQLQRANALIKRQVPPLQHSGPERTVFNTLQTSATLDKGVLHTDTLQLETDFLKVQGHGTLVVATEAIDYQLVAAVSKSGTPGAGLDALQSVQVPLLITGTVASPTVRPDIQALAKGQLKQEVQKKAGDLVKGKLGDKLKDLLGH